MEPPRSLIPDVGGAVGPGQIVDHLSSCSWGMLLIVLALLLLGAGETDKSPAEPPSRPEAVSFLLVKGELMALSAESCIIKDSMGKIISFKVDEQTSMIDFVHEGDLVEVYASPEGLARSVFKALCGQDSDAECLLTGISETGLGTIR